MAGGEAKTRVAPAHHRGPTAAGAEKPPEVRTRRGRLRGAIVALLALVALAVVGGAVGFAVNAFEDASGDGTGPVSEGEVREVVARFAKAYEREDLEALGRTLARDAERVLPGDRQRGRASVVAAYKAQFSGSAVERYALSIDDATGGVVGRAEGRYRVSRRGESAFGGEIVFSVVREGDRPRIGLIAVRPDS